jgi:hypothetical protein
MMMMMMKSTISHHFPPLQAPTKKHQKILLPGSPARCLTAVVFPDPWQGFQATPVLAHFQDLAAGLTGKHGFLMWPWRFSPLHPILASPKSQHLDNGHPYNWLFEQCSPGYQALETSPKLG